MGVIKPVKACAITVSMPDDSLFEVGRSDLRPESAQALASVAAAIRDSAAASAEVQGHSDSIGSDSDNQALSERRARAVVDALQWQLPAVQLKPLGYGDSASHTEYRRWSRQRRRPPAQPPGGHGHPPQRSDPMSRSPTVAAACGLLATTTLLTGCGVAIVRDTGASSTSGTPTDLVVRPSTTARPRRQPAQRRIVVGVVRDIPPPPATYAGWARELRGLASTTRRCDAGPVTITQAGTTTELTGSCGTVTVDAAGVSVLADHIDRLVVVAAAGVVVTRTVGSVEMNGSSAQVYWVTGSPQVVDQGGGNSAKRIEEGT